MCIKSQFHQTSFCVRHVDLPRYPIKIMPSGYEEWNTLHSIKSSHKFQNRWNSRRGINSLIQQMKGGGVNVRLIQELQTVTNRDRGVSACQEVEWSGRMCPGHPRQIPGATGADPLRLFDTCQVLSLKTFKLICTVYVECLGRCLHL